MGKTGNLHSFDDKKMNNKKEKIVCPKCGSTQIQHVNVNSFGCGNVIFTIILLCLFILP
jgi:protein-arginine kinase activator protein McsA